MPRRNWTREELVVAFNLYCKLPFGQMHRGNPQVVRLSGLLERTPSAVAMKLVNFASLDPLHQKRGISGLKNASHSDTVIWSEFHSDWTRLGAESERAYRQLVDGNTGVIDDITYEDEQAIGAWSGDTETQRLLTVRLGQAFFREVVLAAYNNRCCICALPDGRLLVASHIVPWAKREDSRVNPRNGLCLCALHDRAFDRGLISVDPNLTVIISPQIRMRLPHPIIEQMFIAFEGRLANQPDKFMPEVDFLRFHHQHVFQSA